MVIPIIDYHNIFVVVGFICFTNKLFYLENMHVENKSLCCYYHKIFCGLYYYDQYDSQVFENNKPL